MDLIIDLIIYFWLDQGLCTAASSMWLLREISMWDKVQGHFHSVLSGKGRNCKRICRNSPARRDLS